MPELPEVESYKKYFDSTSLHKTIKDVKVLDKGILSNISSRSFVSKIKGEKFKSTYRHGKYLFAKLSENKVIVLHFGMTGFLKYFLKKDEATGHIRVLFSFSNGYKLAYDCQRKFGKVTLIKSIDEFLKKKKLGEDPISNNLSYNKFKEILGKKTGNIKSALLDQKTFAGIGNLYSDEILFQANIHPLSVIKHFKEKDFEAVYKSLKDILKKAVKLKADFDNYPESWLVLFREDDENCPKCNGIILHKTIGGRTSYFCTKHQKIK